MIRRLFPILALTFCWLLPAAVAQGQDVNPRELDCLTNALYKFMGEGDAERVDDMAWVLRNRKASAAFPGDYCALGGEGVQPPWQTIDLTAIMNTIRESERGSDARKAADATLAQYQQSLNNYQMAQFHAFKLLSGWDAQDPTEGRTSLDEEPEEDSDGDETDAEAETGGA